MLPEGVGTGSIINLTVERNKDEEQRQRDEFQALQEEIYHTFSKKPKEPVLETKSATQTSITIRWDPLVLYAATFRGIDVYRNGQRLNLNVQPLATSTKLTGLEVEQEYEIWIVVRTSAGEYPSSKIRVKTHSMDNLTGLNPCFGTFASDTEIQPLVEIVERVGASYTDDLSSDNTHLICTVARGPKYEKALELNIPIVSPEFLKACEQQQKIMPSHSFYINKQ